MENAEPIWKAAADWLAAARSNLLAGRMHVAFEEARHAAELACKAILWERLGSFPKHHDVSGIMFQKGIVPAGVEPRALGKLLGSFTVGGYGFEEVLDSETVASAIEIAQRVLDSKREPAGDSTQ